MSGVVSLICGVVGFMHMVYSIVSSKAAVPVVWPRVKLQSSVFWTPLPRKSLSINLVLPVSDACSLFGR